LKNESLISNATNTLSQFRSITPPVTGTIPVEEFDSEVDEPEVLVGEVVGEVGVDTGVVGVDVVVGVLVAVAGAAVTVIRKLPEEELPASSVAEQLTLVVPTPNVEPDEGEQSAETEALISSVAEAE
jgi:hypothetical protein